MERPTRTRMVNQEAMRVFVIEKLPTWRMDSEGRAIWGSGTFKMFGGSFPIKLDPRVPNNRPMAKRIKTGMKKKTKILRRLPLNFISDFFSAFLALPDI
jgi:hypothetical protein